MQLARIETLDDPRLDVYRDLRGNNRTRDLGLFLAEGTTVVRRLIESDFDVQSVMVSDKKIDALPPDLPDAVPVYRLRHDLARRLVGYSFHAGVLACGYRRRPPSLERIAADAGSRAAFLVGLHVVDPENVGALIRIGAAFGVSALIFGPGTADPFSRRVLRVSVANGLFVPIVESPDPAADLRCLRTEHGVELMATVVDPDATPLPDAPRADRFALLFGHETTGLDQRWVDLCDHRVTIPMRHGADSLNVAASAGIFLHELMRDWPRE